ncbi:MAG: energy-coupling factor transporter transmembrane protein EcfT [Spirochaetaceae bacterium]|jgi:energy-coupling factor transport system permease protein|nr:energy-coupling factor transporter transmembrane protein EcfT [Spirochaetaceae bacterium]
MKGLFEYKDANSILHRLHPLTKLAAAFLLCAVCFVSKSCIFVLSIILLNLAFAAIARVTKTAAHIVASLGKLSCLIFIVQLLFVQSGNPLLHFQPFTALPPLIISDKGLQFSLLFVLRLIAISLPLVIMLSVTKVEDINNTLVQNLHIPTQYAFTISSAIRFIPIFQNEMNNIMEAQKTRGIDFETKNFFKKIGLVLPLCAPLLVSSVRKIENTAIAADLRGFHLRTRDSIRKVYYWHRIDVLVITLSVALIPLAIVCNNFY